MKRLYIYIYLLLLTASFLYGCRDPYEPSLELRNANYLVVEGFLNSEKPSVIKLSRLNDYEETLLKPEELATVEVIGEDNSVQVLSHTERGRYSGQLHLGNDQNYRVLIKTIDGKEYLSDYLEFVQSPEIEKVSWEQIDDEVHFFVDTKDPDNNTQYYRWEYEETWSFTTPLVSSFEYYNGEIIPRRPENLLPHVCYSNFSSNRILLKSTAHMAEAVVLKHPLYKVNNQTNRLQVKYSVLVKQYALTKQAFQFWHNLQKNTEGMGSIFDPQPTQLATNITCISDPKEMVVGFISLGNYSEKRIFIDVHQELRSFRVITGYEACKRDTVFDYSIFSSGIMVPVQYDPEGGKPTMGVPTYCADCRTRGTDEKPDFWDEN